MGFGSDPAEELHRYDTYDSVQDSVCAGQCVCAGAVLGGSVQDSGVYSVEDSLHDSVYNFIPGQCAGP